MIELHVTKKLLAKLPLDSKGVLLVKTVNQVINSQVSNLAINPLNGWHANLLLLQRRQCVILIHDTTRFAVFIPCLTKPDFANLNNLFEDSFINTLLNCGASQAQLNVAHQLLAPFNIDSQCDRSVQGTMNRMAGDIEHYFWHGQVNVSEITGNRIGAWLAERPCNIKGQKEHVFPGSAMLALLDEAALMLEGNKAIGANKVIKESSVNQPSNVISIKDFKRNKERGGI